MKEIWTSQLHTSAGIRTYLSSPISRWSRIGDTEMGGFKPVKLQWLHFYTLPESRGEVGTSMLWLLRDD